MSQLHVAARLSQFAAESASVQGCFETSFRIIMEWNSYSEQSLSMFESCHYFVHLSYRINVKKCINANC